MSVAVEGDKGRVTKLGRMVIELYPDEAPLHVANFLDQVAAGTFEGVAFHRVVPGFIIQGGDPTSRADWKSPRLGLGGGDCSLPPEVGRQHTRGAVAAARKPDEANPGQETSCFQFYICLADLPGLDRGNHSVFGQVVEGTEVVEKVARVKNAGSANMNRALQRVFMTEVQLVP
jgi:peptidyl-prolyl cis-trans isomerase B (cyclophilin B)